MLAAETEERLEHRHRRVPAVDPERELVQVGLEVLAAHAVVDAFFAALDRPDPDLPLLAESKALRARLAAAK